MLRFLFIFLIALALLAGTKAILRLYLHSLNRRHADRKAREDAAWIGTTGLDEDTERQVPFYLRLELREFLDEPGALKAGDLEYLGIHTDDRGPAHFWRMPERDGETSYAYVDFDANGKALGLGWGDRSPLGLNVL